LEHIRPLLARLQAEATAQPPGSPTPWEEAQADHQGQPDPDPALQAARELAAPIEREQEERDAREQQEAALARWTRIWLARVRERLEVDEDDELPEGIEQELAEYVRGEEAARFFHNLQPLAIADQPRAVRVVAAWGEQEVVDRFVALARERRQADLERMRRNRERASRSWAYWRVGDPAPDDDAPHSQGPASPEPQKTQEPPKPPKRSKAGRKPLTFDDDRASWRHLLKAYNEVARNFPSKTPKQEWVADKLACSVTTLRELLARCSLDEDGSGSISWRQVGEAARRYRESTTKQAPAIFRNRME
jgi:hypothetical protein